MTRLAIIVLSGLEVSLAGSEFDEVIALPKLEWIVRFPADISIFCSSGVSDSSGEVSRPLMAEKKSMQNFED